MMMVPTAAALVILLVCVKDIQAENGVQLTNTESTFADIPKKRGRDLHSKNGWRSLFEQGVGGSEEMRSDIKLLKEFYNAGNIPPNKPNENPPQSIFDFPNNPVNETSSVTNEGMFEVIIIGAGWAGLAAAMTLKSKEITNFKILEARDEIGGRSRTVYETLNGKDKILPLDLGSMWLLGGVDNPMYDIINATGNMIRTSKVPRTEKMYQDRNAGAISDDQFKRSLNPFYNQFLDYQSLRSDYVEMDEPLQVSVDLFLQTLPSEIAKNVTTQNIANNILLDYAGGIEEMSLLWWNSDYYGGRSNSTDVFLPDGYAPMIKAYAAPIHDKVLTEATVNQIDSLNPTKIKVTYERNGHEFVLNSKKVIVTVPLGVLKAENMKFLPTLPKRKKQSIQSIGFGRSNKIFLMWNPEDVFWPKDVEILSNAVSQSLNHTKFMFFNALVYGGKSVLFAFFKGRDIERVEDSPDFVDVVSSSAMFELRNMFGNDIKEPEKVVVTKWNLDPFSRGTYSFNKVQVKYGPIVRKWLKQPFRKKRLYIAGEATSFRYFGTVHGAYFSGVEAANSIVRAVSG